jgi:hypothetical protein
MIYACSTFLFALPTPQYPDYGLQTEKVTDSGVIEKTSLLQQLSR